MIIKQIADAAFFAKRCRLLNHWIEIQGIEMLILALVEGRDEIQLWYMTRNPYWNPEGDDQPYQYKYTEPSTHRERLRHNTQMNSQGVDISFMKIGLGPVELAIESTSSSSCHDENVQNSMALQYFFEQGMDLGKWNEVEGSSIQLSCASVMVSEGVDPFAALENAATTEIVLETSGTLIQRPLSEPLKFSISLGEIKTLSYKDPITGTSKQIHLNGAVIYDLWASIDESFQAESVSDMPEKRMLDWRAERERMVESICPKGKVLAMLEYQEERGLQLEFYDSAYLDSPCHQVEGVAGFWFGSGNTDKGPNGYPYSLAMIRPVTADETGPFEVELLSVYELIQEECLSFPVS